MSRRDFLEDFVDSSLWSTAPAKYLFEYKKDPNTGMKETHRLALTMGGVIDRSLDDTDGLQSSDYATYQIFEEGDLAFKLIDLQNIKTSRVGLVPRRGIMSPAYIRLVSDQEEVLPEFYYWYFYAAYLGNIFNGLGGGIRQNLNQTDLLEFPVPQISHDDQLAIIHYLKRETARIDGLIEKKARFIALLKEKRVAVIAHAVTKGLNRDAPMKDSGQGWLGEVPAHWDVVPIKRHIHLQSGYAFKADLFSDTGTRLVRMNNLKRGYLDLTNAVCIPHGEENQNYFLRPGDLLLGMSGSIGETGSLGNFCKVRDEDLPCLLNQRVGRFVFKTNLVKPAFFEFFLQSKPFLEPVFLTATSTAQFNISPEQVGDVSMGVPPIDEQDQIVRTTQGRTSQIDTLITKTEQSIGLLKEKRAALITAAVTGKIDVRSAA